MVDILLTVDTPHTVDTTQATVMEVVSTTVEVDSDASSALFFAFFAAEETNKIKMTEDTLPRPSLLNLMMSNNHNQWVMEDKPPLSSLSKTTEVMEDNHKDSNNQDSNHHQWVMVDNQDSNSNQETTLHQLDTTDDQNINFYS